MAHHLMDGLHMSTTVDTARVLVADDQSDVRTALGMLMRDAGLESDSADNVDEVRRKLRQAPTICCCSISTTHATRPRAGKGSSCSRKCMPAIRCCRWW